MAMLAEPRSSRKKWTLNPRGKLWSNDENKFGQKMLEKMGWSKGKGLGRTEQGETEPIRVTTKSDMKGVGFKDGNDEWLAHKDEFNSILSQLNGTESVEAAEEKVAVKSLETRSKKSKFRVHYHKFTRGKDLSKYSAQDMACILGKRPVPRSDSPPEEPTPPVMEEVKCEGSAEEDKDEVDRSNGFVTISKGNIHDYFASKMAALRMKAATKEESSVPEVNGGPKEDVMEMEPKVEEPAVPECSDVGLVDKKRVRFNEDLNVVNEFSPKMMILAETTDDKKSKKRKKNAEHEESKKKRKIDSEVTQEEEVPQKNKKKKKRDREETVVQEQVQPATNSEVVRDQTTMPEAPLKIKKKKKKIKVNEQESAAIEEAPQTSPEITEPETAAPSKKKKSKDKGEETTEVKEAPQSTPAVLEVLEPVTAVPLKKKKKSKSNREETTAVKEAALEVTVQLNDQAAEPGTATPSKKKKSEDDGEETTAIQEATQAANEAPVQLEENVFEPTPSKKKKTKSKGNSEETAAIEETAPAATEVPVLQLEEQVIEPATPTPSKKKKTKSKGNREETAAIEKTAPATTEVHVLQLEEQVIELATPTPSKKKKTKSKGNGEETTVDEAPRVVEAPEPSSDGAAPETKAAAPPKKRKKSKDQQEIVAQDPMPAVEQESILTDPAAASLKTKKKKRKQDINDQDSSSAMDQGAQEPILATPDSSNSTSNDPSNSTPADPSNSTSTDPSSSTLCDSQSSSGPHRGHHAVSKWKSKKKEPKKRKGSKKSKASKMVSLPVKIEPNFTYLDAAPGSDAVKKALKKLESAQFHLFVNSNLHHVTGYGNV